MKLLVFCMLLISNIGFYFFYHIDALFLILTSSQYIVISLYSTHRVPLSRNYTRYKKMLCLCTIAAIIGYVSGFRYFLNSTNHMASSLSLILIEKDYVISRIINAKFPRAESIVSNLHQKNMTVVEEETSALIIALLTGNRDFLHVVFSEFVRKSGISHLLALSGFHLSLLLVCIQYLINGISIFFKHRYQKTFFSIISIAVVWIYCVWVGFIPSLYRAALMFSISAITMRIQGKTSFLTTWITTLFIFQLFTPSIMYAHGFILSMCALLGVVYGTQYSQYLNYYLPLILATPISMGLGAMLFTAWYAYLVFGASYPIGLFVSIVLTPLITLFMVLSILFVGGVYFEHSFSVWYEPIVIFLGTLLDAITHFIVIVIVYSSQIGGLYTPLTIFLCYIIVLSAILGYSVFISKKRGYGGTIRVLWAQSNSKTPRTMEPHRKKTLGTKFSLR